VCGEIEDVVAQGAGCQRHRLAGDDGSGARERAGVKGRQIGVGIDDGDAARARAEDRGRDLPVRRHRSVPHLGRSDREVIGAIGQQRHLRPGAVLRRGTGFQHRQRDARALRPFIPRGLRQTASGG
jgi:hypothetical protein